MQAKRRYYEAPAAAQRVAVEDSPSRYWGLVLIAACTASWVVLFGSAKLLLALI